MSMYYSPEGHPISLEQWNKELTEKHRVAETTLPNGLWVSTLYFGIYISSRGGLPLIFETMVFDQREGAERGSYLDCRRYATEEEAKLGHDALVAEWSAKALEPVVPG
jgi:hypothetical protein